MDTVSVPPDKRGRMALFAVVFIIFIIAAVFAVPRVMGRKSAPDTRSDSPKIETAVLEKEVGKVGDLTVTEEAMQLAEIKLGTAQAMPVAEKLEVSGAVEAGGDRLVKITPRVPGKVVSLTTVVGDSVRAGQTLGLIESTELAQAQAAYNQARARVATAGSNLDRQKKLARLGVYGQPRVQEARAAASSAQAEARTAESEVAGAQAEIAEAESDLKAVQASLVQAEAQVDVEEKKHARAKRLLNEQLISTQEMEQAEADHKKAAADIDSAKAKVAQGQAKITTARAMLDSARAKLDGARKHAQFAAQTLAREEAVFKGRFLTSKEIVEAEAAVRQARIEQQAAAQNVRLLGGTPGGGSVIPLVTPIAGRVQGREATLGETVDSEHPAYTVINLNVVWAQLAVNSRDLPRVRMGQRVELTSENTPGRIFTGTVSTIGSTADETTRLVRVRTALTNPGDALKPGSYVRGWIVTEVRRDAVAVPPAAIQEHTGKKTVYVALPGQTGAFEVRHVKLGTSGKGWREIAEGLRPGEKIAVNGTFYLKSEALKSELSDGCCAVPGE